MPKSSRAGWTRTTNQTRSDGVHETTEPHAIAHYRTTHVDEAVGTMRVQSIIKKFLDIGGPC